MVGMANVATPGGLTVALVGAECSGKTTLARSLALGLGAPWVPEYARTYLTGRSGYEMSDVLAIARGQRRAEQALSDTGHRLVIADTDLIVIKIWWTVRFGENNAWIDAALREDLAAPRRRLYLLPRPDFPWVGDPLRENPDDREALHARYRSLLDELRVTYRELTGSKQDRLAAAKSAVRDLFRP
jgi:NadR type nicotinamide-nucleotide adenylyltransferase